MVAKKSKEGNLELTVKDENLPVSVEELVGDAGAGLEGTSTEDYAIPFLVIIQQMSPQLVKGDEDYIKGAEAGCIFNTVTKEIYPGSAEQDGTPLVVCPVMYQKKLLEWRPRESGGGLVAIHDPTDPVADKITRDDRGRQNLPNGNVINTTAQYYVLLPDYSQAMISMTSTQLKASRGWNTKMRNVRLDPPNEHITPPIFSRLYSIGTHFQKNDLGTWYGWQIEHAGWVKDETLYRMAKEFHAIILKGLEVGAASYEAAARGEASGTEEPPF